MKNKYQYFPTDPFTIFEPQNPEIDELGNDVNRPFSRHYKCERVGRVYVLCFLQIKGLVKEREERPPLGAGAELGAVRERSLGHHPQGDVGVDLAGVGGLVKVDGGLVQVGLEGLELGLDPLQVAGGAVEVGSGAAVALAQRQIFLVESDWKQTVVCF